MKYAPKLILGHRGYPPRATENTLASAMLAMEAGADGLEFDVQKTKDAFIVFHDDNFERLAGNTAKVAEAERKLWQNLSLKIPDLEQWLAEVPASCMLNLELKEETVTVADCEAIDEVVRSHCDPQRVLVSSFEHSLLPPFRAKGYRTALLFDEPHFAKGILGILRLIRVHRPWSLNLPVEYFEELTPLVRAWISFLVRQVYGVKILVWTVDTQAQMALIWPYCDGLITNETERAVAYRKSH